MGLVARPVMLMTKLRDSQDQNLSNPHDSSPVWTQITVLRNELPCHQILACSSDIWYWDSQTCQRSWELRSFGMINLYRRGNEDRTRIYLLVSWWENVPSTWGGRIIYFQESLISFPASADSSVLRLKLRYDMQFTVNSLTACLCPYQMPLSSLSAAFDSMHIFSKVKYWPQKHGENKAPY